MSTEEENKRIASKFFDLVTRGEIDEALDLMADDVDWTINAVSIGTRLTKQIARDRMTATRSATGGAFRIWPVGMTAEGDRLAVEAESHASFDTGQEYNNLYHYLFEINGGKIIRVAQYFDTAHMKAVVFPATSKFSNLADDA